MTKLYAALAFAGLALIAPAAHAEDTVSIQIVRALSQVPYYIALGKGYFAQEGLKVESGNIRSALDTVGPLATGQLDASMGAATAGFFNAAHRGFDLRIVAVAGIQGPSMATPPMVRKALWDNGTIRSGKDLKGHKVAINAPGDITEYFLTRILKKNGLTFKDINETPLAFAQQLIAYKTGAIDAGFLPEPLATTAELAGNAIRLKPETGIGAGAPTSFVFFGTKFMQQRPKVALAFLRALIRGARDAQGAYNKDPALAALIAKEMGLKVEAVENCTPYAFDPNMDIAKYETQLRQEEAIHRENGRITYKEPLPFKNIIDAAMVHEAAASLVKANAAAR